jgi:hypothetical protein
VTDIPAMKPVTPITPESLAHEIFEQAVRENGGDEREASVTVLRFFTEALVYSAGLSCGGDEVTLKDVLGHLGKMIAEAPAHPIVAAVTAARDAKKQEPSS